MPGRVQVPASSGVPAAVNATAGLEALVRLLSGPSADVVVHAASILGNRRESTAVRALANLLTSSDMLIRYSAARALGQIGDAEARRALLDHVGQEDDNDTRELIAGTLATM